MPIIDETVPTLGLGPQAPEPAPPHAAPLADIAGAAFEYGNSLGALDRYFKESAIVQGDRDYARMTGVHLDPNYDPFKDIHGYEDYAHAFVSAASPEDVRDIKSRIDRELHNKATLSTGGWAGTGMQIMAGILDPINLVPVGGEIARGGFAARGLRAGLEGAAIGGGVVSADELALHGLQETRTPQESLENIATGAVFTGVIGGALGLLGGRGAPGAKALEGRFNQEFAEAMNPPPAGEVVRSGSLSAASVRGGSLADEGVAGALGIEKLEAVNPVSQNPMLQALSSPSLEVRQTVNDLAEVPLYLKGNATGAASPISAETLAKLWVGPLGQATQDADAAFARYRQRIAAKPDGSPKLDRRGFSEQVAYAARRNDQHQIPEVAETAKVYRDRLINPLKDDAVALGQLPEGVEVTTADSYLTRLYDREKIEAGRNDFIDRALAPWLTQQAEEAKGRFDLAASNAGEARPILAAEGPKVEPGRAKIGAMEGELKAQRPKAFAADADVRRRDRLTATLKRDLDRAKERLANLKPTDKLSPDDPLVERLNDIRKGAPKPKGGKTLLRFLSEEGGVNDIGGELSAMDAGSWHAQKPGARKLIREPDAPDGLHYAPERVAERAYEAGYISEPDEHVLYDAVRRELGGEPIRLPEDASRFEDHALRADQAEALGKFLQDNGIDPHKLSDEAVAAKLAEIGGEGDARFVRDTPTTRARAREAAFNIRRLEERLNTELEAVARRRPDAEAAVLRVRELREDLAKLREEIDRAERRSSRAQRTLDEARRQMEANRVMASAEQAEIRSIAEEITNTILGSSGTRTALDVAPTVRGPMKERVLNIPDHILEPWLVNDMERVMHAYTRTMAADTSLARKFGRADMADQIKAIEDSYARLHAKTPDGPKQMALARQMERDKRNIEAMRDRIRGSYGLPKNPHGIMSRLGRSARALNFTRMLGGVTVSSISDVASVAMTHGLSRVFGDGLIPLAKNLNSFRVAASEAKLAGTALDLVMDGRAMQLADVFDDIGHYGKHERALQWASQKFGKLSLISYWNAGIKQFSAVITQTRMLEAIEALSKGTISQAELRRLRYQGITDDLARRIANEVATHGEVETGLRWAHTDAWTDREAREAFRGALVKEVDRIIVTPGQEKPLWMSSELGKTIGQFRSFTFSSMTRTLAFALQQRDLNALQGFVAMGSMGLLQTYLKAQLAGRPVPSNPTAWVASAVDASGMLGWVFDANNVANKFGFSPFGNPARYQDRGALESLGGPSVGLISDIGKTTNDLTSGQFSRSDLHKARGLLPFQNLFYLRHLFDAAEDATGDVLHVPGPHLKERRAQYATQAAP